MPTYDYECENGHRFEAFQSMKDEPLRECRDCGAPVRRLIGPGSGFIFKGGGFYITDYRSKDYKEKAKSDSKSGDAKSAGPSANEAKPSAPDSSASSPAKGTKPDSGGSGTSK